MKTAFIFSILLVTGCQNISIAYKSNVSSSDSQVNQATEVSPDVQ